MRKKSSNLELYAIAMLLVPSLALVNSSRIDTIGSERPNGMAVAAAAAGFGVKRFGYPVVLFIAAALAVLAALVLRQIRSKTASTS